MAWRILGSCQLGLGSVGCGHYPAQAAAAAAVTSTSVAAGDGAGCGCGVGEWVDEWGG